MNKEWVKDANCLGMDTELFFPKLGGAVSPSIREVCRSCAVIDECTWYANEMSGDYGYMGGMSPTQRQAWRRRNKVVLGQSFDEWKASR